MFPCSKDLWLFVALHSWFRNIREYFLACTWFDRRIMFSANLQIMQLKCQADGFAKRKPNVLLFCSFHNWDKFLPGPHFEASKMQTPESLGIPWWHSACHLPTQPNVVLLLSCLKPFFIYLDTFQPVPF